MGKKVIVNGEEVEVEESGAEEVVSFFKDPRPIAEIQKSKVDEAYLSAYEEMKHDEKTIKDNLEIMNKAIKGARLGSEPALIIGKMAAFFTDVSGKPQVDWEAMARGELGKEDGSIDAETVRKYTSPGKPQVRVIVKRLGT